MKLPDLQLCRCKPFTYKQIKDSTAAGQATLPWHPESLAAGPKGEFNWILLTLPLMTAIQSPKYTHDLQRRTLKLLYLKHWLGGRGDKLLWEEASAEVKASSFPSFQWARSLRWSSNITQPVCSAQKQELSHFLVLIKTSRIRPGLKAQKHTSKLLLQSGANQRSFRFMTLENSRAMTQTVKTNSNILLSLLSQGTASRLCKHVEVITRVTVL